MIYIAFLGTFEICTSLSAPFSLVTPCIKYCAINFDHYPFSSSSSSSFSLGSGNIINTLRVIPAWRTGTSIPDFSWHFSLLYHFWVEIDGSYDVYQNWEELYSKYNWFFFHDLWPTCGWSSEVSVMDGTRIYQVFLVCILFVNISLTEWCKKKAS